MAEDTTTPVYLIRSTNDVGIGNRTFFSTEQHPKKHTDTFGILTLQTTKFGSYADAQNGCNPKNVIVRCTKCTPTLRAVLAKTMAWMIPYKYTGLAQACPACHFPHGSAPNKWFCEPYADKSVPAYNSVGRG